MTVLPFSLNELISLLKSMRLGWGPPLELVTRTSKQLWVMEADVWADLLIVCCCGEDVDLTTTTTSCNHAVCLLCIAKQKSRPRSCPECRQTLTALIFTSALATEQEELTSKFLMHVSVHCGYVHFYQFREASSSWFNNSCY